MTDVAPDMKMQMVKVTNCNSFTIKDMYDGVPYIFRPNEPLSIPPYAATHFFGWPGDEDDMKRRTTMRFGWNNPEHIGADKSKPLDEMFRNGMNLADYFFSKIKIETINYAMVEETADQPLPDVLVGESDPEVSMPMLESSTKTSVGKRKVARKVEL